MRAQPIAASQNRRIVAGLPFVESLARRMAASMPNSIDIGDLVQDGVLGLIDAAHRFDEDRGIKFETFAERRVRGAMINALRQDAWPPGADIGVKEWRDSQLHARAIRRLRDALGDMNPEKVAEMRRHLIAFAAHKPVMAKVEAPKVTAVAAGQPAAPAVVLAYKPADK